MTQHGLFGRYRLLALASAAALVVAAPSARAQTPGQTPPPAASPAGETPPVIRKLTMAYKVLSNDLYERTVTEDISITSQAAIGWYSQYVLSLNEHFSEQVELAGETIKADGAHLKVEPDKILVSTVPNASQMGIFQADVKNRTMVFPNVEMGDTLHYLSTTRGKAAAVPGGFDIVNSLPASARVSDAQITLDAPSSMNLTIKVEGFTQKVAQAGDRTLYTWSYSPQAYHRAEPGSISPLDFSPFVMVTNRESDAAVGEAFYARAAPKAEPTAEVMALAGQITAGISGRREQARAIHDYVSTKIRYFFILLGQGGWVPHDVNEIIAAKFGDCKDHATLMRALLAAKGIEADYALININPTFRDVELPLARYDHVILYLPEFDAYDDPTAINAPFGILTGSETGKLVLRIGKKGVLKTRTPLPASDANHYTIAADVILRPNGTPVGKTVWSGGGTPAMALRAAMASAEAAGRAQTAKDLLARNKWRGTGDIEWHDALDHTEPYVVKTSFDLTNVFFGKGNNANTIPIGPGLLGVNQVGSILGYLRQGFDLDIACSSNSWDVAIALHLPEGRALAKVPDAVDVTSGAARYWAIYRLDGHTLHIERHWRTVLPQRTCTKADALTLESAAKAASRDANLKLKFAGADSQGETSEEE